LRIAAVPYLIYAIHYGSPTPQTPAQIALITDGARAAGWANLLRKSFPEYLWYLIGAFVADRMPPLGPRSALNYAMLIIPAALPAPPMRCGGSCAVRKPHAMSSWSPASSRSA
jgi:hypothetical protein